MREPAMSDSDCAIRTMTAIATAPTHTAVNASIHHTFVSLPVPTPWSTATGQLA